MKLSHLKRKQGSKRHQPCGSDVHIIHNVHNACNVKDDHIVCNVYNGIIWEHLSSFGNIQEHFGAFEFIWELFGP